MQRAPGVEISGAAEDCGQLFRTYYVRTILPSTEYTHIYIVNNNTYTPCNWTQVFI